ncbi:MAG: M23 family metallopeptidase [Novosphingobium sp.]|uniref:murein hydrolase activator EnvC family protein n=1 Tax=Novosphingobium sp. TaxID=1874826 RepID=UPI00301B1DBF
MRRLWLAAALLLLPGSGIAAQGRPENLLPQSDTPSRKVPTQKPAPRKPAALPAKPPAKREAGAPRLAWPTSGAVTSRFGAQVKGLANNGIDLAAFAGMTVHAAAAGKVVFAGTEPERFGQLIVIEHGGGWVTAYAYLGQVKVTEGQKVSARQVIARIGKSGEARRPGLHFELRKGTAPRNPALYLPIRL